VHRSGNRPPGGLASFGDMATLLERSNIVLRCIQVAIACLVFVWVFGFLGGLSFSAKVTDEETGANDTFGIFNWHPILMTLAFVGCMGEAILTYSSPIVPISDRKTKKYVHASLNSAACVFTVLGIVAAIQSHTLKKPMPMSNFYSTHSYLGVLTCVMMICQIVLGFMAYLFPQWSLSERQAFSPLHKFFGGATFVVGMMTVMVGLQEKTTFLQLVQHPSVRAGIMQIPAILQVLMAVFTVLVMFSVVCGFMPSGNNFIPLKTHGVENEMSINSE